MIQTGLLAVALLATLFFASCEKSDLELGAPSVDQPTPVADGTASLEHRTNQNSVIFPPNANMFGKSYTEWSEAWWAWVLSVDDCSLLPITDSDGSLGDQNQSGQVFFLAGTFGAPVTRDITIPVGKGVFFPLINGLFIGNCPGYYPAPGQTLEEYYREGLESVLDQAAGMSVTLDGTTYTDFDGYRGASYLFDLTANPAMSCFDSCITGDPQPVGSDGFWVMLKPMSPGVHTLTFTGELPQFGFVVEVTYNITVE